MNRTKRFLIALSALLLSIVMVASCNNTEQTNIVDPPAFGDETPSPEEDPPLVEGLDIVTANGLSSYSIVYSIEGQTWERAAAYYFQKGIEAVTGVKLAVKNDFERETDPETLRTSKEILIGSTSRSDSYTVPAECADYGLGYASFVAQEERLVILAGSQTGMYFALRDFFYRFYGQDLEVVADKSVTKLTRVDGASVALHINLNYTAKREVSSVYLPYIGQNLEHYQIVYDGYVQKRMSYLLYESIKSATGIALDWVDASNADPQKPTIFFETVAKEADAEHPNATWIAPGEFRVDMAESNMIVRASNYYGFSAAAESFVHDMNSYGFYDYKGDSGLLVKGNYLDIATGMHESNKYANTRAGEHRVMFYNVLFWDNAGDYKIPTGQRNVTQSLMIAEYMPDVLGCQEFNRSKRHDAKPIEGYEDMVVDLVKLLEQLGYTEAVDPRVKNAYPKTEKIPGTDMGATTGAYEGNEIDRNQVAGEELDGYGTSGSTKVTVDGNTYKTYWNQAPLFYNHNTTKCIKAEYYWYKNQLDMREGDGAPGHVDATAAEAGSKGATWGVFESLETGERYIVITTHMCTRSDYIRWLQGREIVKLTEALYAEYQCPIFFGGDLNGNNKSNNGAGSGNIQNFEAAGFISIQDNDAATDFTSHMRADHGYPNTDEATGLVAPCGNDERVCDTIYNRDSIDKIYAVYAQETGVKLNVFGVVIDDCTLSGSDHLPLFIDFDISKT